MSNTKTTYADKNGRERIVTIDVGAVERCRSHFGVNLYDLAELGQLASDTLRFLRLIHCSIDYDENAKAFRSTFEDWWLDHTGDAGDACVSAFIEALCDVFPKRLADLVRLKNREVSQAVDAAWSQLESEYSDPASLAGLEVALKH